jgi:regulator of cell morphogenesis and NO signaling
VPTDACGSYRALYAGLEDAERDLHTHIHKENNILFPRLR